MGVEPAIIRETGDNHGGIIDGSSLINIWDVEYDGFVRNFSGKPSKSIKI